MQRWKLLRSVILSLWHVMRHSRAWSKRTATSSRGIRTTPKKPCLKVMTLHCPWARPEWQLEVARQHSRVCSRPSSNTQTSCHQSTWSIALQRHASHQSLTSGVTEVPVHGTVATRGSQSSLAQTLLGHLSMVQCLLAFSMHGSGTATSMASPKRASQ